MKFEFSGNRKVVLAGAYVVCYALLAWLTFARPALAPAITPWNPQAGLTLAVLFVIGPRWSLATAIAMFITEFVIRRAQVSPVAVVGGSLWVAASYGVLAAMLRRLLKQSMIQTTSEAAKVAGASAVMTLIAAIGYVGAFIGTGDVSPDDALRGIARYWFAELNGALMLAPLLLPGNFRDGILRSLRGRRAEIALQSALVLVLPWAIFALPVSEQLRFFYLLFVPVIWIALRWGWSGALLAVLAIQAVLIVAAEAVVPTPRFVDLQVLMLTLCLAALLLGAVVAERWRTETELRERDAALSRAMRFAVAGELASSLTHELNQPITALISYLNASEILAKSPSIEEERLRQTLRKATHEAMRASDVLHRLRNFYVGGGSRLDPVNIRSLCNAVTAGFADTLRSCNVNMNLIVDDKVTLIEADETQFAIMLHNLIANAVDAAAGQNSPEKRIEVRASIEADRLCITVDDTGGGILSPVLEQLFEPFVTSKPDGMGLGLALSRSLARARGGELFASSQGPLGGARFTIVLPLTLAKDGETT
ncbi:MAG: ATP-binding protein [Pseudomonadota bacterium]